MNQNIAQTIESVFLNTFKFIIKAEYLGKVNIENFTFSDCILFKICNTLIFIHPKPGSKNTGMIWLTEDPFLPDKKKEQVLSNKSDLQFGFTS